MMIEVDDDWLRRVLNVHSRKKDLGEALQEYLYGDPRFDVNREQQLGVLIVRHIVETIRSRGGQS